MRTFVAARCAWAVSLSLGSLVGWVACSGADFTVGRATSSPGGEGGAPSETPNSAGSSGEAASEGGSNGGVGTGDAGAAPGDAGASTGGIPKNEATGGAGGAEPACAHELDVATDPSNCGVCGHDCLGGDCLLGQCQPIEIAKNQGRVFTIDVDESFIYWAGDGSVVAKKSIDNTGEVIELVPAASQEYVYYSALVGQTLYWGNDWKDNGVRGCALPSCSGGPKSLISGTTPLRDLVYSAAGETLYYTQGSSVWRKALPGGTAKEVVPSTNPAARLSVDDSFVYWSEYLNKVSVIKKATIAGSGVTTLASKGLAYLNGLAARGNSLFVLEYPRNGGTDRDAQILRVPLPAGVGSNDAPVFAPAGLGSLNMAVDDSGVYWTQRDTAGLDEPGGFSIRHCPLTGCTGAPELLAATVSAWGITTDAQAVYWTTETGLVMKLAK
jgi:hypothetical protein